MSKTSSPYSIKKKLSTLLEQLEDIPGKYYSVIHNYHTAERGYNIAFSNAFLDRTKGMSAEEIEANKLSLAFEIKQSIQPCYDELTASKTQVKVMKNIMDSLALEIEVLRAQIDISNIIQKKGLD